MWPGSHQRCYRYLTTRADGAANGYSDAEKKNRTGGPDGRPTWARGMQEAWEWCEEHITPVDCYGSAGTVVFYHNKLAHMAGANYSDRIRQATLCGFGLSAEALPDEELLDHALDSDIWRDWSEVVRQSGDDFGRRAGEQRGPIAADTADTDDGIPAMWYSRTGGSKL